MCVCVWLFRTASSWPCFQTKLKDEAMLWGSEPDPPVLFRSGGQRHRADAAGGCRALPTAWLSSWRPDIVAEVYLLLR